MSVQPPLWPSELTAWGTIAVAIAAVAVALFAELRASQRVRDERIDAAKVLADERAAADARLQRQLDDTHRREQEAGAWAVQVSLAALYAKTVDAQAPPDRVLEAEVVNKSAYTISQVSLRFSPDGTNLVPHHRVTHLMHETVRNPPAAIVYGEVVTAGRGLVYESGVISADDVRGPHVIVRWHDHLGQQWENKRAVVRRVVDGEQWQA